MRFASLHLRAYGPFTNTTLDFETSRAGLHIILGPNEAGKTSALRALTAFLFGVPGKTTDNFLHEHGALRVGGVLVGEDGRRHAFMRRKGTKVVLMQMDPSTGEERTDRPAVQEAIDALIPGVDESLFKALFGLSHERLREGGKALTEGQGHLGSAIFAASAGLSDVRQALAQLDELADELFAPTARTKKINVALRGIDEAGKAYREAMVRPKEWRERDQRVREAESVLKALQASATQKRREQSSLVRLMDLRPVAVSRRHLMEQISAVSQAPDLPLDVHARVVKARERLQNSAELIETARGRITANQAALAKIVVSQVHLDEGSEIEAIRADAAAAWAEHERAAKLEAARVGEEAQAKLLLQEVLPGIEAARAAAKIPSAAVAARLKEYSRRLRHLDNFVSNSERNADRERERITKAETALSLISKPADSSGLQAAIEAARQGGDMEAVHSKHAARFALAEREVARSATALGSQDSAALLCLPLPQKSDVEAFQKQFADIAAEQSRLVSDESRWNADTAQLQCEMAHLEASGAVVTVDALAQTREKRDQVWQGVRRAYVERAADPKDVCGDLGLPGELPQAYEEHVRIADQQADGLRNDAERSTKYSENRRRIKEMAQALERLGIDRGELDKRKTGVEADWAALCKTLGVQRKSPAGLLEWIQGVDGLRKQAIERDRLGTEVEIAAKALATARKTLVGALKQAGQEPTPEASLNALITQATRHVSGVTQTLEQIAQLEREKALATEALDTAQAETNRYRERRRADQEASKADLVQAGLEPSAFAEEVEVRLDKLAELRANLQGLANTATEIAKAKTVWEGFVARMSVLLKKLGTAEPQKDEEWPSQASAAYTRLMETRKTLAEREKLSAAVHADEAFVKAEEIKQRAASAVLDDLAKQAGCDVEGLDAAIEHSERKHRISADLEKQDEFLGEYSKEEVQSLLDEAAGSDPADLKTRIDDAGAALQSLEGQVESARATLAQAEAALSEINGSDAAAEHCEVMEHHLAIARREAANYMRLRLAHGLLATAIRTYQDRSQGPVMKAASTWFEKLTGGRYRKLVVDYVGDEQVMLAERADGERLSIGKLSEGTVDQLYLALRLAAIEVRLESTHAMPLILDDALLAFDDARAVHALKAFAELGKRNQTILFTHHAHVVRLAQNNLESGAFAVHELSGPTLSKGVAAA